MTDSLSLNDGLVSAGRLAARSVTMLRLWSVTASDEGHLRHRSAIRDHWEHLRFIQHGLLFSAVVGAHGLLAGSRTSLTIPKLIRQARDAQIDTAEAERALAGAAPIARKMGVLRHEAFAHLSPNGTYNDAFDKAGVTPNELHAGSDAALAVVNLLLQTRELPLQIVADTAVVSYQDMLALLLNR